METGATRYTGYLSVSGPWQRFLSVHGVIQNCFRLGRHELRSTHYRVLRGRAFAAWNVATATNAA